MRVNTAIDHFASERDLVEQFQTVFLSEGTTRWRWLCEFGIGAGFADLIAVNLSSNPPPVSLLARINSKWAYTLYQLPIDEPFGVAHVANMANISENLARTVLKEFCHAGACVRVDGTTTYMKTQNPEPIAKRIVAVEAKLRDWRKALYQAAQHASYASQSWVVLDMRYLARAVANIEEFTQRGVGLAAISRFGEVEVVVSAPHNMPRMPTRFWQANAEIARRLAL